MATAKPKRTKQPRDEHPRLIGFTEKENGIVVRAATKGGMSATAYIREAALFNAREDLGLVHPKGEG